MNALALTVRDLSGALSRATQRPGEGRLRLSDAITIYNNSFSDRQSALEAFEAGRAAYWTTVTHHAVGAVCLMITANGGTPVVDALEIEYRRRTGPEKLCALETLVPLNRKAAEDLAEAYARFGLWRDAEELELRRLRDFRSAGR